MTLLGGVSHLSWERIARLEHPELIKASFAPDAVGFVEVEVGAARGYAAHKLPLASLSDRIVGEGGSANAAASGVRISAWSAGGRYLATCCERLPSMLWLWDGDTLGLHSVVLQQQPISNVSWNPSRQVHRKEPEKPPPPSFPTQTPRSPLPTPPERSYPIPTPPIRRGSAVAKSAVAKSAVAKSAVAKEATTQAAAVMRALPSAAETPERPAAAAAAAAAAEWQLGAAREEAPLWKKPPLWK